jgi:hypothetical protein
MHILVFESLAVADKAVYTINTLTGLPNPFLNALTYMQPMVNAKGQGLVCVDPETFKLVNKQLPRYKRCLLCPRGFTRQ